jgi:predicted nucleic acid-binding protein
MIVLDTNVISELMRPAPNPGVVARVASQPGAVLHTTYINQAGVFFGIANLPEGRRSALTETARTIFAEDFSGRIRSFGAGAASCYPEIVMTRRRAGKPIDGFDALIAATALAAGAIIATRDVGGFEGCCLTLINPRDAA